MPDTPDAPMSTRTSPSTIQIFDSSARDKIQSLLERERAELTRLLRDVNAEINALQDKLERTRHRKRAAFASDVGEGLGSTDGIESGRMDEVVERLLQMNNASLRSSLEGGGKTSSVGTSPDQSVNQSTSSSDKESGEKAKNEIRRLAVFTKINFTETSNRLVSADQAHIRLYDLAGKSCGLHFRLHFEVNETELFIRRLRVFVPPSVHRELASFVVSVERDNHLHGFFRGFVHYAQLNQQRKMLFEAMGRRFPRLVRTRPDETEIRSSRRNRKGIGGDGVAVLKFCDEESPSSPELVFLWDLLITPTGRVLPDIRVKPSVSREWKMSDRKNILVALPDHFQSLVELRGLQPALEAVVKCMFGVE
ncbi:uncharacterized protein VTP21DRAFT_5074 [Calcarisporiella thermophila]|uniref:uncharacterized protein n=1 Tax=Calcarisporiella thermophila TaxID=911321 RepID=UPI0037439C00